MVTYSSISNLSKSYKMEGLFIRKAVKENQRYRNQKQVRQTNICRYLPIIASIELLK